MSPTSTAAVAPDLESKVDSLRTVRALSEEQALTWFVTLNRTDVTDGERMAFNRWLGLDPRNRESYRSLLTLWQRLGPS